MMPRLVQIIELVKYAPLNMFYTLIETFCIFNGEKTCAFMQICHILPRELPISPHWTQIQDPRPPEPKSGLKYPVNFLYIYSLKSLCQRGAFLSKGSLPRRKSTFPF